MIYPWEKDGLEHTSESGTKFSLIGVPISRKEALNVCDRILKNANAERERLEALDNYATED